MEDTEKIKQRFELLKMAQELLREEYINHRAEDHNKWLAENEELWRTKRRNVPYPPFTPYPTDEAIVSAASNLYNFIYKGIPEVDIVDATVSTPVPCETETATVVVDTMPPPPAPPSPFPVGEEQKDKIVAEVQQHQELIPVVQPEPDTITPTEPVDDLQVVADPVEPDPVIKDSKGFLPGWIRRSQRS